MTPTLTQTRTQPQTPLDAFDAWCHEYEAAMREAAEADAMFTAETSGGRTLMERVAGPLLFLAAAGLSAVVIIAVGRGMGWIQ